MKSHFGDSLYSKQGTVEAELYVEELVKEKGGFDGVKLTAKPLFLLHKKVFEPLGKETAVGRRGNVFKLAHCLQLSFFPHPLLSAKGRECCSK